MTRLLAALVMAAALWWPRPAVAEKALPVERSAPGIQVRAEAGLEEVAARIARGAAEDLQAIAADLEGLPRPPRAEIRVVRQTSDLSAASPRGDVPDWAVGVAFSDVGVVVVALRRGNEILDVDGTVAHELAHLALGAALGGRAPRWLNEGFAYLHSSDWSVDRIRTLIGMAWSNDPTPLAELDRTFPAAEQAAHRAYAQSYDFVAFLARRGRHADPDDDGNRWPFRDFLARIAAGATPSEAALGAYGARLGDLFGEWRTTLRSRYLFFPAELFGIGVWCLAALLLVIAFFRRRRKNRKTLARWEEEESARASDAPPGPSLH